ncbi:hypothetical protein [Tessaracoccus lacteus]|uniref:LPXTG cell wall anchor domain-containing protein n=1 Tax=Tessaracoccus lacteus TaxID=3041766 RepID=A0ABY8PV57_9ACTN|nr:hypothetical protein [Tessaracoccus sp. T21]WGT46338.1 hypothetical protein QH948_09235 [Tessaracoccus sp. T21]
MSMEVELGPLIGGDWIVAGLCGGLILLLLLVGAFLLGRFTKR